MRSVDEPAPAHGGSALARRSIVPAEYEGDGGSPDALRPGARYLAGLPPGSRRSQWYALRRAAAALRPGADPRSVPWHLLDRAALLSLRAQLLETNHLHPRTVNRILSAVRKVIRISSDEGIAPNPGESLRACSVPSVRFEAPPRGRALSVAEVAAIFAATDRRAERGDPIGFRDGAILAVLLGCGLRRAELAGARAADLHGATLLVRGKGRKEREVVVPAATLGRIAAAWESTGAESNPDRALVAGPRGGAASVRVIWGACGRAAREARVDPFRPHDLRRTFITRLLEGGWPLAAVKVVVGHASVVTTDGYFRGGVDLAAVARDVFVPSLRSGS